MSVRFPTGSPWISYFYPALAGVDRALALNELGLKAPESVLKCGRNLLTWIVR